MNLRMHTKYGFENYYNGAYILITSGELYPYLQVDPSIFINMGLHRLPWFYFLTLCINGLNEKFQVLLISK